MVKTLSLQEALKSLRLPALTRNLFSSPDWLSVIQKTYATKIYVKYIEREGEVESYIVYSVVQNFLEWKICICSYCDYCDCYVHSTQDWQAFIASLKNDYPAFRIAVRNLRDPHARQCGELNVLSKEKFHILDTRDSLENIWRRTDDSFKAAVGQARRSGVVVRPCPKTELKKFYRLHLAVRKNKYRIFPQPYRFFENIWEQYLARDKGVLLGAYNPGGKFIGGNIYLICGGTLYYKFNTSDQAALKLRPNNLLFWEGVKFAKSRDLDAVDLGSSGCRQEGLIRFKDHAGAQCHDITHLGWHPPEYKFSPKRILRVLMTVCTLPMMPSWVVRVGSRLIYPYLA